MTVCVCIQSVNPLLNPSVSVRTLLTGLIKRKDHTHTSPLGVCSVKTVCVTCLMLCRPVGEQEGADVRHRRRGGPQLCQRHDVFKGDVSLGAHVHHLDLLRRAVRAATRGPPDDLHHHGVLGSAEGLRRLLMAGLGQLLPVHLRTGGREPALPSATWRRHLLLVTVATDGVSPKMLSQRPLCLGPKIWFLAKRQKNSFLPFSFKNLAYSSGEEIQKAGFVSCDGTEMETNRQRPPHLFILDLILNIYWARESHSQLATI